MIGATVASGGVIRFEDLKGVDAEVLDLFEAVYINPGPPHLPKTEARLSLMICLARVLQEAQGRPPKR